MLYFLALWLQSHAITLSHSNAVTQCHSTCLTAESLQARTYESFVMHACVMYGTFVNLKAYIHAHIPACPLTYIHIQYTARLYSNTTWRVSAAFYATREQHCWQNIWWDYIIVSTVDPSQLLGSCLAQYSVGIVLLLCQYTEHSHTQLCSALWVWYAFHLKCAYSLTSDLTDTPRFVPQLHDRSKRNTVDAFRIRVLLLADHSVHQHHNSRDEAEKYLLAIMNIVSLSGRGLYAHC